jgi:hypothetical protein
MSNTPFKKVWPEVEGKPLATALNATQDLSYPPSPVAPVDNNRDLLKADGLATADSHHGVSDKHILIIRDNQGQQKIDLDSSVYSVGRNPECDIELSSHFASRHHATLLHMPFAEREDCCYCIVDGNLAGKSSTNGLFVNGKKVKVRDLKDGDELIFAPDARASYHRLVFAEHNTLPGHLDATVTHDILHCLDTNDTENAA